MKKEKIQTDQAPAAIGPYVQAVKIGNLIYTAGQGGLDPEIGKLVEGGVEAQAEQSMRNLAQVLKAGGSNFENVVKTTIFLRYIKDFEVVNTIYASHFEGSLPARSTVAVSALPMGALVEIEMVALVSETDDETVEETKYVTGNEKLKEVLTSKSKNKTKSKKGKGKKKKSRNKKKKGK